MRPRFYQQDAIVQINNDLSSNIDRLLYVLATGAGKTFIATDVLKGFDSQGFATAALAHRKELLGQIAISLARAKIKHRIIAPPDVVRQIINDEIEELGYDCYDGSANCGVISVDLLDTKEDTVLIRTNKAWMRRVRFVFMDEGHHLLRENKWGRALKRFPDNVKLLLVTATPTRADGKGLGEHAHGVVQKMIVGIEMRDLINLGYLTDYRIICPESDMDFSDLRTAKDGDYTPTQLRKKFKQSNKIIGDIVEHYKRYANGKRGVTFVPDVESAKEVALAYNKAGIPAEVVTAKTPARQRKLAIKKLKAGILLQLVNVDLFGEGFDLPAIDVVSMARKTESYALYAQQFGRALRLVIEPHIMDVWEDLTVEQRHWYIANSSKPIATIIDHVGNVLNPNFGLPDSHRKWTLDDTSKRRERGPDEIPIRRCLGCLGVFIRWSKTCPSCGFSPNPPDRTKPEFVEGDLTELTPEILSKMRGDVDRFFLSGPKIPHGAGPIVKAGIKNKHKEHRDLAFATQQLIDQWAELQFRAGLSVKDAYIKFYRCFGIDAISACTQPLPQLRLTHLSVKDKVNQHLNEGE